MRTSLLATLLVWIPIAAGAAQTLPRFEPGDCPVEDAESLEGRVECGVLVVPESRSRPSGRTLRLAVAVVKAQAEDPEPDPVMVLHGGPGGQLVRNVGAYLEFSEERDVILLDQRGCGRSEPVLCPDLGEQELAPLAEDLSPEEEMARRLELQLACRDELRSQGFDLGAFNSDESAADLNDLRETLGYDRWNLFGLSYGTKLALTTLRHFPKEVRSVVLDSAYPPAVGFDTRAVDFARALEQLHEGCAADPACHAAYPDVRGMIRETIESLQEEALEVPVAESFPADVSTFAVNHQDMLVSLHQTLYNRPVISAIPFLVAVTRDRNTEALEGFVDMMGERASDVNRAVYNTVECYERFPFWSPIKRSLEGSPWADILRDFVYFDVDYAVCAAWSEHRAGPEEGEPVVSDVPTLILAGQYDPTTPPAWGRRTGETLARSRYARFPHIGHGAYRSDDCPKSVVERFIHDPTAELDLSCIEQMEPIRFFTDLHVRPGIYRLAKAFLREPRADAVGGAATLAGALLIPPSIWTVAAIRRRRRGGLASHPGARAARLLTGITAALGFAFLAGLMIALFLTARANPVTLVFGLPGCAAPLFGLPWLAAALTPGALIVSIVRFRWVETLGGRLLLALGCLGCVGLIVFCARFGLF